MSNQLINDLAEMFKRFPGIGPRQAKRFVYFLLQQDNVFLTKINRLIAELPKLISTCPDCQRFYQDGQSADHSLPCPICRDKQRHNGQLLVVEKDTDLDALEKTNTFAGQYFVLGGLVPILEKEPEKRIRWDFLHQRVENLLATKQLTEIIFALAVTTEADHTIEFLREKLAPLLKNTKVKFSLLGRGLSGGLEIEYSDPDTLKSALQNRH